MRRFVQEKRLIKCLFQTVVRTIPIRTIVREAKKHDTILQFVAKERLDQLSETGKHQGVVAHAAAYEYAEVEDILTLAKEKGEDPFIFILDNMKTRIIWERLSVRQILQGLTG